MIPCDDEAIQGTVFGIKRGTIHDGAGSMRILWQILVPLSKPALASVGIFSFLYTITLSWAP